MRKRARKVTVDRDYNNWGVTNGLKRKAIGIFWNWRARTGEDHRPPSSRSRYFFLALPSITVFQVVPSGDISYFMSYVVGEVIFTV
jgi:hypothetical protein